jgi:RimJ/RimL family protein N-acetyltransferase
MRYYKLLLLGLLLSGCSNVDTVNDSSRLQQLAAEYEISWDEQANRPNHIKGEGGVVLRPCNAGNEGHQDLFIELYTHQGVISGYLEGKQKTTPEALHVLIHQSYKWEDGDFFSGFVGYTPDNIPFIHCGLKLMPSKHMAEVYLIDLPEYRKKGYSDKAVRALERWASFLQNAGTETVNNKNIAKIQTLVSRVSPDNITLMKLLLNIGFEPYLNHDQKLSDETKQANNDVKVTKRNLVIDGNSFPVMIVTTRTHPEPRVILLKRIKS